MHTVTDISYEQLKIVAFDGAPRSSCAPVLPVVLWKARQCYFKQSTRATLVSPKRLYTHSEYNSLLSRGLITELPEPHIGSFENALLVYASKTFLDELGINRDNESLRRYGIHKRPWVVKNDVLVFCFDKDAAHIFLNRSAEYLSTKAETSLTKLMIYNNPVNSARTEELLNLAFDAALDRDLRLELYVLDGVFKEETGNTKRLDAIFCELVKSEFPQQTWEEFLRRVRNLGSQMRDAAVSQAKYLRPANELLGTQEETANQFLKGVDRDLGVVRATLRPSAIRQQAKDLATKYNDLWQQKMIPEADVLESLQSDLLGKIDVDFIDSVDLPPELIGALATEEMFWHSVDAFSIQGSLCSVSVSSLSASIMEGLDHGIKPMQFFGKIIVAWDLDVITA
jgi:hypothetical protein